MMWRPRKPRRTGFKTQWTVAGDAAARTITLPLVQTRAEGALAYNFTVTWGDGTSSTVTAWNDANRIHTYAANGTYNVDIRGTCEGWSFNNAGDKLKIRKVVSWGDSTKFNGFKYLKGGFFGCINLAYIGAGPILAGGTGILTDGFQNTFRNCSNIREIPTALFRYHTLISSATFTATFYGCTALTSIPADLFRYNTLVSTNGFDGTFYGCTALTSIPTDLFRYNTLVSTNGFIGTFRECTALTSIPTDLFRYNTLVSAFNFTFYSTALTSIPADLFRYNTLVSVSGFFCTFYNCTSLTTIPTDLFRYNTLVSTSGFSGTFYNCTSLTTIPTDLFRYNTLVSTSGFSNTFNSCTSLSSLPEDLFRYNTAVSTSGFNSTFLGCTALATVPTDLFRYNIAVSNFNNTFQDCDSLCLNNNIFYGVGEEDSRFLNRPVDFTSCFERYSFTGIQGIAPELWNCDYGDSIVLDVAPGTDWAPGDIITGQSSGAIREVVSKTSSFIYRIKKRIGAFTLGEVVGVTGVPAKLADQGPAKPTITGVSVIFGMCFGGIGNSIVSISNYVDIPDDWKNVPPPPPP